MVLCVSLAVRGSPPQAWGRRRRGGPGRRLHRFTPTGVGTAYPPRIARPLAAVHPHRRGDGLNECGVVYVDNGSPPQAWGRRATVPSWPAPSRFTPTGVGTAAAHVFLRHPTAVHPHRRGDGETVTIKTFLGGGSPPQAWGRRGWSAPRAWSGRFTPTGVGTAPHHRATALVASVHPHRRGDGTRPLHGGGHAHGSPPQAWGRQRWRMSLLSLSRFTPTGVGTASQSRGPRAPNPVHPHRRGDGTGVRFV